MSQTKAWNSYRKIATQTASPGQLVLMLFEGAIRFLEKALTGFQVEDPAESNELISNNVLRAQEIIFELNVSLNMNEGGQLAATLRGLYQYMDRRLTESNLRKETVGILEVLKRLGVLREAWSAMLLGQNAGAAQQSRELAAA